MFSNRRPYYGLKLSIADFFREPVRYLKASNTKESMSEKPYLLDEYPKMHLNLPGFDYKPKKRPGIFGPISSGVPYGGLAIIDYGEARCSWDIINTGWCISEPITITLSASYFWTEEFKFVAEIVEDTIGVTLSQLPETKACSWDEQDYQLNFPENANGSVTICGFASAHTLISQTFETVVAGMPVGIYFTGSAFIAKERGQENPAITLRSSYGDKGANCGCITIETSCDPCGNVTPITWDDAASADTVARNNSCTVAVQDGLGPYNWSVAGTGFTITAQTAGVSNTLIADGVACGAATITVTDQCGGSSSGYVRCTTGVWYTDFSISIPQPPGWNGSDSCSALCGATGVLNNWLAHSTNYDYFDTIHRTKTLIGSGGWCFESGCSGFSAINTFNDGYTATTEEVIVKAVGMARCPTGCLKPSGGMSGQRWGC